MHRVPAAVGWDLFGLNDVCERYEAQASDIRRVERAIVGTDLLFIGGESGQVLSPRIDGAVIGRGTGDRHARRLVRVVSYDFDGVGI